MRLREVVLGLALIGLVGPRGGAGQEERAFAFSMGGGGFLGVTIRDVGKDDLAASKLTEERGVVVRKVDPDGPGAKAGLKEGDVILAYQGEKVLSAGQFARLVRETPTGRSVTLDISRAGAPQSLKATVGEGGLRNLLGEGGDFLAPPRLPAAPPMPRGLLRGPFSKSWLSEGSPRKLGIRYEEISGQLAKYFHLNEEQGVLVVSVDEGGPAAKAGLRAGDILLKLNGNAIRTSDDLSETVERLEEGSTVSATVLRDGRSMDLRFVVGGDKDHKNPSGPSI
jgi:serine protease Do